MARRNSAVIVFRTLVMLACLVAVPSIAVFGTLSPEGILSVVKAAWTGVSASRDEPLGEAAAAIGRGGTKADPTAAAQDEAAKLRQGSLVSLLSGSSPPPTCPNDPARQVEPDDEPSARVQQRLRELGATSYQLETWGDRGELYRFHCRVAVNGSAGFSRHFEATDADPLHATEKVLAEVEAAVASRY